MVFRPATPGFVVTLAATICLAVVVFSVPWLKSIYFLQGNINSGGVNGTITLGVLGYCFNGGSGDVCSKPSIGYEFDPNALLGIDRIKIPAVVVKWITYALVLHVVALILAAGSSLFGLLAHVREMSMICCSNCFSGFAASMALIAFIFDIVLFFIVRSRITAVGGTANIGTGVWLTLAAWVMLFFASCFYSFGQCCLRSRPRVPGQSGSNGTSERYTPPFIGKSDSSSEQLRLDAVKAEADRKQRQRIGEVGLPAFQEYEAKPLRTQFIEEEEEDSQPYRDGVDTRRQPSTGTVATTNTAMAASAAAKTGYTPAPRGTTAMDEYYSPSLQPRQPQGGAYHPTAHQWQQTPGHVQVASHYPEIIEPQAAPTPAPAVGHALFASNYGQQTGSNGHQQYLSTATGGRDYGHEARGTSYHSAHSHFPSAYSQSDYPSIPNPYEQAAPQNPVSYQAPSSSFPQPTYITSNAHMHQPPHVESYYNPNIPAAGYGNTSMSKPSAQHRDSDSSYYSNQSAQPMPPQTQSAMSLPYVRTPGTVSTTSAPTYAGQQQQAPAPPRGPRSPTLPASPTSPAGRRQSTYQSAPTDMPPSYEAGPSAGPLQPEKS